MCQNVSKWVKMSQKWVKMGKKWVEMSQNQVKNEKYFRSSKNQKNSKTCTKIEPF